MVVCGSSSTCLITFEPAMELDSRWQARTNFSQKAIRSRSSPSRDLASLGNMVVVHPSVTEGQRKRFDLETQGTVSLALDREKLQLPVKALTTVAQTLAPWIASCLGSRGGEREPGTHCSQAMWTFKTRCRCGCCDLYDA